MPSSFLSQQGTKLELTIFAVLNRCQRIRSDSQTCPHGSLRPSQFYSLGTAFCERGAKLQPRRFCVLGLVSRPVPARLQYGCSKRLRLITGARLFPVHFACKSLGNCGGGPG